MGTIAEKLTYLNTTKTMLKDSLNKFGSSILSTDTFRSYDTKLNEIYDKLPKVTQSGAGFTLSEVQNGQVDDFKMNGVDLEQNTTNGINKFYLDNNYSVNYGEASIEVNNNNSFILRMNKTSSNKQSPCATIEFNASYLKPNTTYTISKKNSNTGYVLEHVGSIRLYINGSYGSFIDADEYTFTTPGQITNFTILLYLFFGNSTPGNYEITFYDIQLEENSTATDFEPYTGGIPSPNPDYPQDIKVVEGKQVITDKGKNLLKPHALEGTINGITVSYDEETRVYTFNGTCTQDNTTFVLSDKSINFIAGVTKSITYWVDGSCSGYCYIRHYDSSYSVYCNYSIVDIGANNDKIEQLSDKTFLNTSAQCSIRFNSGSVANNLQIKVMVTDDENTDYEPYYEPVSYNIDLSLENIQLAKMPNTTYKNKIYKNNGNWYYERNVEKIILDGSEDYYEYSINEDIIRFQPRILNDLAISLSQYVSNNFKYLGTIPEATEMGIANGISTTNSRCFIFILKSIASNTANFKTWLSTHNTEVWYILETPVTTQITNTTLISQLETISTFKGTNIFTITNDNNIIPEIEITRLKELEKLA